MPCNGRLGNGNLLRNELAVRLVPFLERHVNLVSEENLHEVFRIRRGDNQKLVAFFQEHIG